MKSKPRNFDEYNVYLNTVELKPDFIYITEARLSEQNSCETFNLDGYHPLLVASRKKWRRGVGFYVKKKILLPSGVETKKKQSADH